VESKKKASVLVVDDEKGVRQALRIALEDEYHVLLAGNGKEADKCLADNHVDAVLLDIRLPDTDGITLLKKIKRTDPALEVVMITAVKYVQTAVAAIKAGAYEYIVKPFVVAEILNVIKRALEKRDYIREVVHLRRELDKYKPFEEIVAASRKMQEVFSYISAIAPSDGTVLIQGESGTGKELVARAIHNRSQRWKKPFLVINCAAVPQTLMERELFGHNKGAFTGAVSSMPGKLEMADNGTVFLDDIDSMEVNLQSKLLRVIQEKEFERLGSARITQVDVRFVAACNKDLRQLISQGGFREDLYFRLNVFPLFLPPLRKRRDDIPLLLEHFLTLYREKEGRGPERFSQKAVDFLSSYDWPGNVRELENLVHRICTITRKRTIQIADVPVDKSAVFLKKGLPLKEAVHDFERNYISETLEEVNGNRKNAARRLGIHRNTLLAKMNQLGLKGGYRK